MASETSTADAPPTDQRSPRRRPGRWRRAVLILALALSVDLARVPDAQLSTRALLWVINTYQATLSPWMPAAGVHCRFTPTCSHFGEAAIRQDGAFVGTMRTGWRILRCGPWTPEGTRDPP